MAFVRTFTVTVSGGKYYINSVQQPTINLAEGGLYKFDVSDSSNADHDLRFSTTSDGTHAGGSVYTTGVDNSGTPGDADAYLQIQVASGAPDPLYYFDTEKFWTRWSSKHRRSWYIWNACMECKSMG